MGQNPYNCKYINNENKIQMQELLQVHEKTNLTSDL